ncbi:hypothetical protein ACFFJT_17790 [Dyella flava]|uniref:hypothetical protein n=1 Tax=Dyella flava TaxID=1920170 RepID=UPI00195AF64A|nr:hypothetical protein [Dyella flava]
MPSAATAFKPLTPFQSALARLSCTETAKYLRLTLGLWIGFVLPYLAGYPDTAVALCGSAMLTLALGNSISAARGYLYRRVVSNVLVMPVGTLVILLTAPYLWLGVLLLPLAVFAIARLRPSLFQMTSVTVPMTLVLYSGEHVRLLEERLFGVVLGMPLGFIIQQCVLPPDHGYRANRLVREGNQRIIDALAQLTGGTPERHLVSEHADRLHASSAALRQAHDLFKLDLQQAWIAPHLRRNRHRLPLYWCHQEIFRGGGQPA